MSYENQDLRQMTEDEALAQVDREWERFCREQEVEVIDGFRIVYVIRCDEQV